MLTSTHRAIPNAMVSDPAAKATRKGTWRRSTHPYARCTQRSNRRRLGHCAARMSLNRRCCAWCASSWRATASVRARSSSSSSGNVARTERTMNGSTYGMSSEMLLAAAASSGIDGFHSSGMSWS